ncbi:MAG: FAD-dependent monooxygenase [Actinobacteria bacterium]|nr:FAD-dependent monooxygenase [Actinomycetota bacterium]
MKKFYDVIISGAGPSGSLLGYFLANKNIKTLILEKENFPRYKVCAGGIQWKVLQLLPFNIEEIIEKKISGIYFSRKLKDIFYKKYHEPLIYTVNRKKFDNFIANQALNSGCQINFKEKVMDFSVEKDQVKIITKKDIYFSKILVGADGAGSIVFKKLNKNKKIQKIIGYETEEPLNEFSFYQSFDNNLLLDFTGIKKGYLWIFPKNEYLSIGNGGPVNDALNIKKYLLWFLQNYSNIFKKSHLFQSSIINELVRKDKKISSFNETEFKNKTKIQKKINAHFIPVRSDNNFLSDYRVLVIGDAAGFGDGFTGEGLYNAFISSIISFESIINALTNKNYSFYDYFEKINNEIIKNIKLSILVSKIFFSSPTFYYKLIKNNDRLFNSCARILRGEKTYSDVVNKLKLIKI